MHTTMDLPNLQRIALLREPKLMEQAVLAVSKGPVINVVGDASGDHVDPNHYIAMITFCKLGGRKQRADGNWVMPILDEPTVHNSKWIELATLSEALAVLDSERAQLLAAGWLEGEFDPIGDPD